MLCRFVIEVVVMNASVSYVMYVGFIIVVLVVVVFGFFVGIFIDVMCYFWMIWIWWC